MSLLQSLVRCLLSEFDPMTLRLILYVDLPGPLGPLLTACQHVLLAIQVLHGLYVSIFDLLKLGLLISGRLVLTLWRPMRARFLPTASLLDHIHVCSHHLLVVVVVILIQDRKAVLGMHDALNLIIFIFLIIVIVVVELESRTSVEIVHYVLI